MFIKTVLTIHDYSQHDNTINYSIISNEVLSSSDSMLALVSIPSKTNNREHLSEKDKSLQNKV